MRAFEYVAPSSLEEVLEVLSEHRGEAKLLAGGQSLLPLLMYRLARPRIVIDLSRIDLAVIERVESGGAIALGALVRHRELIESRLLAQWCPVLAEAAGLVGNVRVRALGTVGGSLAHADPAAELPMVVTALDGRLTARSVRGEREIDPAAFFKGYLSTDLEADEMLVGVRLPALPGAGWAVEEHARRAGDFAVVAVTAIVRVDSRGLVDDVRLALGGVGATPVRARAAEDALRGHEPSAEGIGRAAAAARDGLNLDSDAFVSAAYRRHLAGVLVRRALTRAVARAMGSDGGARGDRRTARASDAAAGPGVAFAADRASGGDASRHRDGADGWALRPIRLTINGRARDVGVLPSQTLLEVLRDTLGIFDAKEGCGEGVCGACTVLLDGRPVSSCLLLARSVGERAIVTVRGMESAAGLHPLQEAFVRHGAVQCGFCTPGMLLTALAFVDGHPDADRDEIRAALDGNLCRCTGYTKIVDAVEAYARGQRG